MYERGVQGHTRHPARGRRAHVPPVEDRASQRAHTKRVAERGGSRTLELRDEGKARAQLKSAEGPARLVDTKGYSTTLAISTFRKVEAVQILRQEPQET